MPDWDSDGYLQFANERTQPAIDLVNRIEVKTPDKILDVGCGPGNSTNILKKKFPKAAVLGIDNSPNMIEKAKADYKDISFALCDAGKELGSLPRDYSIVFSNACIQWIPDHPMLIRQMADRLLKNGVLAIQVPEIYHEPIHIILEKVASEDKWADKFHQVDSFYNLTAGGYYDVLSEVAAEVAIWQTTYFHTMNSHQDILDWYRTTGLRPYLERLNQEEIVDFEKEIYAKLIEAYPVQQNGKILFKFPRVFLLAKM